MHNLILDDSHPQEAPDYSIQVAEQQSQIKLVKKLAVIIAEAADPIWYLGDGYGGCVKEIIELAFIERGLTGYIPEPKKKTNRKEIKPYLRREVYERDSYECVVCKARKDLTVDHIVPVIKGGTNELDNLQTMCRSCNSRKGTK